MDYENCDMQFIDIRERIKYLKYGYGRATDQLSIEIRNNRISRHDALEIVKKIDGNVDEKSILDFCQFIGITRTEYDHIMESFVNYEIFKKDGNNKIIPIECRQ